MHGMLTTLLQRRSQLVGQLGVNDPVHGARRWMDFTSVTRAA
jgi:hypothetical protein